MFPYKISWASPFLGMWNLSDASIALFVVLVNRMTEEILWFVMQFAATSPYGDPLSSRHYFYACIIKHWQIRSIESVSFSLLWSLLLPFKPPFISPRQLNDPGQWDSSFSALWSEFNWEWNVVSPHSPLHSLDNIFPGVADYWSHAGQKNNWEIILKWK